MTPDESAVEDALAKKRIDWKNEEKDIEFETKNWRLLDGMRFYKPDSFDFKIQSVGVFTNEELIQKAIVVLNDKLKGFDDAVDKDEMEIKPSLSTMKNSYDIILKNEDYTIGKTLEYYMYSKYYTTKVLNYCGFKKMHPHDADSIIRIAYDNPVDLMTIKGHLKECIKDAIKTFTLIGTELSKK
jgi:DNA-directed RNA polymerase subunit L